MNKSLGLLEFTSIARGIEAADAMTKAASIKLEEAKTICPGKYMVIVSGDVGAVNAAVAAGENVGRETVIDKLNIASIHNELLLGINGASDIDEKGAVGVLEFFSVASAIVAADSAAKAADVRMIEVRLGMGIGGKSFLVMTGEISAINAAIESGIMAGNKSGMLIGHTVIPSPDKALFEKLL